MDNAVQNIIPFFSSSPEFKTVLDLIPINVMTCDPATFVIDYANKQSINTLNTLTHLLPKGVSGDNIVGQCIDIFHKDPHIKENSSPLPPICRIKRLSA